jgi:TPR repeat protein
MQSFVRVTAGWRVFTRLAIAGLALGLFVLTPITWLAQRAPADQSVDRSSNASELVALKQKAESGDAPAQLELAKTYMRGTGVTQDSVAAAKWFRQAAEQGNAEAQDALGVMYGGGDGVERDKGEALKWYRKAARQGYAEAMYHVGTAFYNGDAVEISDTKAYAWFALAKQAGNRKAIAALERLDSELKPAAILQSQAEIGKLYDEGVFLPKNHTEAVRWWLPAARSGNLDAEIQMAQKFLSGEGIGQDYKQAKSWCDKALKQNVSGKQYEPRAAYCLGVISDRGLGVPQDLGTARQWYERSAVSGHPVAAKRLAQMCLTAEGGKRDQMKAGLIYVQLAIRKDKEALANLLELKKTMDQQEWASLQKVLQARHIETDKIPEVFPVQAPVH